MKTLLVALSILTLSACSMNPADYYSEDKIDEDHTQKTPFSAQEITDHVRNKLKYQLYDPTSYLLEYLGHNNMVCNVTSGTNPNLTTNFFAHNAYTVYTFKVNGKNRMGGYVGWKNYRYVVHNGKIFELDNNYCIARSQLKK